MKEVDDRISKINNTLVKVNANISAVVSNLSGKESFSIIFNRIKDAFKPLASIEPSINIYNDIAKRIKKEFNDIDIKLTYNKEDTKLMNSLSKANLNIMKSIRSEYESQISALVYASLLSDVDRDIIAEQTSALIIPNKKIVGRALKGVLETEVETFIMETDATLMLKKGNEAGIESYEYIGSLIKDSRPWCISHLNKTLTLSEIQDWNKASWKGKKSGNPFVTRGGWRCRHHFAPIIG